MSSPPNLLSGLVAAKAAGRKRLAVLVDPDKLRTHRLDEVVERSVAAGVDYFFIGGSLIVNNQLDKVLTGVKERCGIPLVLFPGSSFQLSYRADGLLFLSLISGRNPELLIGNHVIAAPYLRVSPLEIMSCGYMLVDGGKATTVSYMSNTRPIPADKADVAMCTAVAGEMLGLKLMYLDAGSGARHPVPEELIAAVSSATEVPLIVGGGIRDPERARLDAEAGADVIVVGNAIERDPTLIGELAAAVHGASAPRPEARGADGRGADGRGAEARGPDAAVADPSLAS